MALPHVASREEWVVARKQLLAEEKELTRARDALSAARRRLPMVAVETEYTFDGPGGPATLLDLFEGRRQLIVDHYMFDPSWEEGCMSCAGRVDQYGNLAHLHARDTTMAVVSRAPLAKIEPFKARMGWTFPWYSSFARLGTPLDFEQPFELHGTSCFLRDGDRVFHTYSTYGRGTEQVGGTHYYLDMTALGRQEDWEG
jgi:predicted dithiol-disulfide oxidoreductase (DUF899 family)